MRGNWVLPTGHKGNTPNRNASLLTEDVSLIATGGLRQSPASKDASLLARGVALMPNGQNPISLENQIYPPAIDTLVTGIARVASNDFF